MCEDYFNLILYEGILQGVTPAVDTALAPWKAGDVCRRCGAGGSSSPPVLASWPPRYKPPGARRSCSLASRAGQPPSSCLLPPSTLHLAPASSQSPPGHLDTWTPDDVT